MITRKLIFAAQCSLSVIGASLVALQSSRAQIVMETPAPIETEITKALGDPYRYDFDLPASPNGFIIAPRSYLEDLDPKIAPQNTGDKVLSTFATPGETEPLSFAIYATDDLKNVTVAVSDLKAGTNILSAGRITVRTVMRAPQRIGYWMKSDPQNWGSSAKSGFRWRCRPTPRRAIIRDKSPSARRANRR
jgi:hypothetical protein